MIDKNKEYLDSLNEIRNMMDRSSRFISLSGLAGVAAGFWALCGAFFAYKILSDANYPYFESYQKAREILYTLFGIAMLVLFLAVVSGIFFTTRKAKRDGQSIWDKKILTLLWNLSVPLGAGGLFCLFLLYNGLFLWVAPATLIFYGLALFNAGNYTHKDVKYLALLEITLGFTNCFFIKDGLLAIYFWAFGFGVLHIVYGILMYNKYEKNNRE
jgi:cbb3-type cytochrome oxidase subunit 3